MQCDYGSVVWRLKATVHRPGPFTPKLSASREVNFVASPSEDDREDVDNVTIERTWEDQMQYMLTVSGRVFPIGGSVPITLTILPMAKVKIFGLSVILEGKPIRHPSYHRSLKLTERVDYFFSFSPTACRKDPKRRFELLSLKSDDENHPLLPLPEAVTSVTNHPLCSLINASDAASEFMANLMGPGPWTLQMCLTVPNACGMLHFSNKNRRAPIEVSHLLKVVLRAQRGDELVDPQSGKPKQFDIVIRMPVHVLSVRCCIFSLNGFFFVLTLAASFFSPCQTSSTLHSRATPRSLMHQHHAPPSRTMGTFNSALIGPVHLDVRQSLLWRHLKNRHLPKPK
jgi:hypothetical protein